MKLVQDAFPTVVVEVLELWEERKELVGAARARVARVAKTREEVNIVWRRMKEGVVSGSFKYSLVCLTKAVD